MTWIEKILVTRILVSQYFDVNDLKETVVQERRDIIREGDSLHALRTALAEAITVPLPTSIPLGGILI